MDILEGVHLWVREKIQLITQSNSSSQDGHVCFGSCAHSGLHYGRGALSLGSLDLHRR